VDQQCAAVRHPVVVDRRDDPHAAGALAGRAPGEQCIE
jgi:hypothetical protein